MENEDDINEGTLTDSFNTREEGVGREREAQKEEEEDNEEAEGILEGEKEEREGRDSQGQRKGDGLKSFSKFGLFAGGRRTHSSTLSPSLSRERRE